MSFYKCGQLCNDVIIKIQAEPITSCTVMPRGGGRPCPAVPHHPLCFPPHPEVLQSMAALGAGAPVTELSPCISVCSFL